jgi:hypothetical protein
MHLDSQEQRPRSLSLVGGTRGNEHEPMTLTVTLAHYHSKPKARRYFDSDEAHAAHVRRIEFYNSRCGTQDLTYETPIRKWTGVELDRLIVDVISLLDALPHDPEDDLRQWYPHMRRGTARYVGFERTTSGRRHMYWNNYMHVHSAVSPHTARVALPEAFPAAAMATVVEAHGKCRFELVMDSNLPYEPMTTAPVIAQRGVARVRNAAGSTFIRKAVVFDRQAPPNITRLVEELIDDLNVELDLDGGAE